MIICDFCLRYERDGTCRIGLSIPKGLSCREFAPSVEQFCSNPKDFVDSAQIVQMASFFGIKGRELKRVRTMAEEEESFRFQAPAPHVLFDPITKPQS